MHEKIRIKNKFKFSKFLVVKIHEIARDLRSIHFTNGFYTNVLVKTISKIH